jgi:hypothetical protein
MLGKRPAKRYILRCLISGRCGRCSRYFAVLTGEVVFRFQSQPCRPELLQGPLKRPCSRGAGPCCRAGPQCSVLVFKNRLYAHRGQADRPLVADRRAKLLTTPRHQLIHSAAPKGGDCGGKRW